MKQILLLWVRSKCSTRWSFTGKSIIRLGKHKTYLKQKTNVLHQMILVCSRLTGQLKGSARRSVIAELDYVLFNLKTLIKSTSKDFKSLYCFVEQNLNWLAEQFFREPVGGRLTRSYQIKIVIRCLSYSSYSKPCFIY